MQAPDDEGGQARHGIGRLARRENECHRLRAQAACDKGEHLGGGAVEPLFVVDQAQQRFLGGGVGEEVQHRQAHQKPVRWRTVRHPERRAEGTPLRCRQPVQMIEEGQTQLMYSRVRQFHLGLHARCTRDATRNNPVGQVIQQRGLADTGLSPQHEGSALPGTYGIDELVEDPALVAAPDQLTHRSTLRRSSRADAIPRAPALVCENDSQTGRILPRRTTRHAGIGARTSNPSSQHRTRTTQAELAI